MYLSYTVVSVIIFGYKCMHVVFKYKLCTYRQTAIFLETCLKQSIFTYKCMHIYARGYSNIIYDILYCMTMRCVKNLLCGLSWYKNDVFSLFFYGTECVTKNE